MVGIEASISDDEEEEDFDNDRNNFRSELAIKAKYAK